MTTAPTSARAERYTRDGFFSPNAALTRGEAAECLARLEAFERAVGGPLTSPPRALQISALPSVARIILAYPLTPGIAAPCILHIFPAVHT